MPLTPLASLNVDNPGGGTRQLQLLQGDLANMSPQDAVDVLAVSAFPGDYAPTPGSLIGALAAQGVSVQALSGNPAANYEPTMPCWISQPVTGGGAGIQFGRVLVFEPPQPAQNAPGLVWSIFQSLMCFRGTTAATLALPVVSTGSAGADPQAVARATFWAAVHFASSNSFPLNTVKLVVYDANMAQQLLPLFTSLSASYTGVFSLPLPGGYAGAVSAAQGTIAQRGVPAGLSQRQAVAISVYTSNYYGSINTTLRTAAPTDPAYLQMMPLFEAIDSGLANVAPFVGTTYRGEYMTPARRDQHSVGAVITNLAYTSTSQTQLGFGADRLTFAGTTGRPIANVSMYPSEAEVLFERGMSYQVNTANCPGGDTNPCTFGCTALATNWCGGAAPAPQAVPALQDAGGVPVLQADVNSTPGGGSMDELTLEGAQRVLAAYDRMQVGGGPALDTAGAPQARVAATDAVAGMPDVHVLAAAIAANGLPVQAFDWQRWEPVQDRRVTDPAWVAGRNVEELRQTLTAHLRMDRFVEGHLQAMLESGVIGAAMARLRTLVAEGAIQ
jgi:hypothetical protein